MLSRFGRQRKPIVAAAGEAPGIARGRRKDARVPTRQEQPRIAKPRPCKLLPAICSCLSHVYQLGWTSIIRNCSENKMDSEPWNCRAALNRRHELGGRKVRVVFSCSSFSPPFFILAFIAPAARVQRFCYAASAA